MNRITAMTAVALLVVLGMTGCGTKERDELRVKVTELEQQLAQSTQAVTQKETELTALRGQLQTAQEANAQAQAQIESISRDLEQTLAELNHSKTELAALKKKKR